MIGVTSASGAAPTGLHIRRFDGTDIGTGFRNHWAGDTRVAAGNHSHDGTYAYLQASASNSQMYRMRWPIQ